MRHSIFICTYICIAAVSCSCGLERKSIQNQCSFHLSFNSLIFFSSSQSIQYQFQLHFHSNSKRFFFYLCHSTIPRPPDTFFAVLLHQLCSHSFFVFYHLFTIDSIPECHYSIIVRTLLHEHFYTYKKREQKKNSYRSPPPLPLVHSTNIRKTVYVYILFSLQFVCLTHTHTFIRSQRLHIWFGAGNKIRHELNIFPYCFAIYCCYCYFLSTWAYWIWRSSIHRH